MLVLVLLTLLLALVSILSSFATLLRILLPYVFGILAHRRSGYSSRRAPYQAAQKGGPTRTGSAVRSGSVGDVSASYADLSYGMPYSPGALGGYGVVYAKPRLRSAQRVQAWLALFDIITMALLLSYWIIASSSSPTSTAATFQGWTSNPPSPFFNLPSTALLAAVLCIRPILLTFVSVTSFNHIRLGRSSYLGKWDWGLWLTTILGTAAVSTAGALVFRQVPPRLASKIVTGTILGLNITLLILCTAALSGLIWTIHQAQSAFRLTLKADRHHQPSYDLYAGTERPPVISAGRLPASDSDHGTFGQHKSEKKEAKPVSEIIKDAGLGLPKPDTDFMAGTITTGTGGTLRAPAHSAVPSSSDPYHLASAQRSSSQKGTFSTATAAGPFGTFRGSIGTYGKSSLTPMPEIETRLDGVTRKERLNSSTTVTSETQDLLQGTTVDDRRPSAVSNLSGGNVASSSGESKSPSDRVGHHKSRKSLRAVLDEISRSVQNNNKVNEVNDWRQSLSQVHIDTSALSDHDSDTLHGGSSRRPSVPLLDEDLPQVVAEPTMASSPAQTLGPLSSSLSPDRIRREVEEQVDRMFSEIGLQRFIKDKWRQIVPTGSLPIVRSPREVDSGSGSRLPDRFLQRASVPAQLQARDFATEPLAIDMSSLLKGDHTTVPHTFDPNFDATFSRTGQSSDPTASFSRTGEQFLRPPDASPLLTRNDASKSSLVSNSDLSIRSRPPAPLSIGTFGEGPSLPPSPAPGLDSKFAGPSQAKTVSFRPAKSSPLRSAFTSPHASGSQSLGPQAAAKLREPFFDPAYLVPTASQQGFVSVPASWRLPSLDVSPLALGSGGPRGSGSVPPRDDADELVQAVQGGGDDVLGAQSALVRIASYATLRAAVLRVEFDLSNEEVALHKEASRQAEAAGAGAVSSGAGVAQRAANVAEQNHRLHLLKEAQWQEERMSNRETRIAFLRLTGHLLGIWIPFTLSLPYLVFALAHPRANSAPFVLPLLLSLSLTLCGPLSFVQTILTNGTGLTCLSSMRREKNPFQSNSRQHASSEVARGINSSDRTLLGGSFPTPESDARLNHFTMLIEQSATDAEHKHKRVRTVAYGREHWAAGDIVGDRVVRPRSAMLRGFSLLFDTRPRLEVLPVSSPDSETSTRRIRPDNGMLPSESWGSQESEGFSWDLGRRRYPARSQSMPQAQLQAATEPRADAGVAPSPGAGDFKLDGLSAMLLPRIVPGLSIGPDVPVADDDEQTLVEQYQKLYRRYLSDLPDVFSFQSARQAFRDARRTLLRRVSIHQTAAVPATRAARATNVSAADATGVLTEAGDESMHSFATAAEASERIQMLDQSRADEALTSIATHSARPRGEDIQSYSASELRKTHVAADGRQVFSWISQESEVSPPRMPVGRSSSVSIDSLVSEQQVTTRSRHGRQRREASSLPDATPESMARVDVAKGKGKAVSPVDLSGPNSAKRVGVKQLPPLPLSPTPDTSIVTSTGGIGGVENSHRRSLASELGLTSARKSLGSEMGLDSVGSTRQRKSMSSDFGLLLAALREKKENSPSSSNRLTSDSLSSTHMSEEISLSTPSNAPDTPSRNLMMHSSPPPPLQRPTLAAVAPRILSIDEGCEDAEDEVEPDGADPGAQPEIEQDLTDEELADAIQQMDPLTLHRYLYPAVPLETLDEVTEEMTNDLTRSLDAIWLRSQRDSFLSMRRQAISATPVKNIRPEERLAELGIGMDTPRSAIGQAGYAYISRRNAVADIDPSSLCQPAHPKAAVEVRIDEPFDNSIWATSTIKPLSLDIQGGDSMGSRSRTVSTMSTSTIGFEKEAEWVQPPVTPGPKQAQTKGRNKKSRYSHIGKSSLSMIKRASFGSSSGSEEWTPSNPSDTAVGAPSVPESPWAVVAQRGDADFTIATPPPMVPTSFETADKWATLVSQRINRFESMITSDQEPVPSKEQARRALDDRHVFGEKTNAQPTHSHAIHEWGATTSPSKRASYPPSPERTAVAQFAANASSLGNKSARTSGTVPIIHVRGPSGSSTPSFYHV
ncbi:hypothetical protein V8E36_004703 [Tilletia maclaganii]